MFNYFCLSGANVTASEYLPLLFAVVSFDIQDVRTENACNVSQIQHKWMKNVQIQVLKLIF